MIINKLKNIGFILFFLIICSCNNDKKAYFSSGNLEYTVNDSVKTFFYDTIDKVVYKKIFFLKDYDSISIYYKNGKLYQSGKQDVKKRRFGNWNFYTAKGFLSQTIEYFIINDKSITNRFWFFNKEGDTLWYAKKFNKYDQKEFARDTLGARNSTMIEFNIYTKDTINLDEPFLASVICNSPLGRDYNSQIIMLLAKEDYNFNKDFSNENTVELDTFYNLTKDKKNRANFNISNDKNGYNYIAAFGRWFKTPGKKILRGYMLEYYDMKKDIGSLTRGERRVYFEKEIYVKR